ncbi:hypothetical protein EIB71_02350 [Kaistella daneshvariae]|uniref:Cell wall anchor protein n=1 Tax=Kaistella daneshvariae TaxID=2487074 RepID=A0ABM7C6K0_9FLAO|nr:hypothetical protein [Kaistella daneshvariae]AZI66592.1 hypothetical protein EIB71_02350 [Kaistella daneshvariae]
MKKLKLLFFSLVGAGFINAQVGIGAGAVTPHASSILDIQSTSKGVLAPRMTTAQRTAISQPAESLLVYDTDLKSFYHFSAGAWKELGASTSAARTNYKLVKSAADLADESSAGGSTSYLLKANTYYEINGTITLAKPINLNNAYVSGLDANEDILSFTGGTVFAGNTGGSIRNVTLKGAQAFNITGPGPTTSSSLLLQNTIIDGMTLNVGSISGFGLYYGGVVQFMNNADGITYSNIGNCLLDNQAWLSSNSGTFEKFTGNFGLIEKGSGFSTVDGSDVAIDVSSSDLAVSTGTLEGTVFSGTTTATSGYIKGYPPAKTYTNFNFSNVWTVNSPGIPRESDGAATGNLYYTSSSIVTINSTVPFSLPVTTNAIRLFRMSATNSTNSRVTYTGQKKRALTISAALSFTATAGSRYNFSIYKGKGTGTPVKVTGSDVVAEVTVTNARQAVSILGTVDVEKDEYIEVYVAKIGNGNEEFLITSFNLVVN